MTPTRSQLDEVLPYVPAGISAMTGDLTEPDERAVALDWLEGLLAEAFCPRCHCPDEIERMWWSLECSACRRESPDSAPGSPRSDEDGREVRDPELEALLDEEERIAREHDRERYGPRLGYTWEVRDGRATIVASNDWPAPAKGTHESDLDHIGPEQYPVVGGQRLEDTPENWGHEWNEYGTAKDWSGT